MYLEGARWDGDAMQLAESEPKVLHSDAPVMLFAPCELSQQDTFPHYECPVYRTPERRGTLATTGHSTCFVLDVRLPSSTPQDVWVRAGVAMLLSLAA